MKYELRINVTFLIWKRLFHHRALGVPKNRGRHLHLSLVKVAVGLTISDCYTNCYISNRVVSFYKPWRFTDETLWHR